MSDTDERIRYILRRDQKRSDTIRYELEFDNLTQHEVERLLNWARGDGELSLAAPNPGWTI